MAVRHKKGKSAACVSYTNTNCVYENYVACGEDAVDGGACGFGGGYAFGTPRGPADEFARGHQDAAKSEGGICGRIVSSHALPLLRPGVRGKRQPCAHTSSTTGGIEPVLGGG